MSLSTDLVFVILLLLLIHPVTYLLPTSCSWKLPEKQAKTPPRGIKSESGSFCVKRTDTLNDETVGPHCLVCSMLLSLSLFFPSASAVLSVITYPEGMAVKVCAHLKQRISPLKEGEPRSP